MQSIEITAKSLDEVKRVAADKLGGEPDQVEVTVLEETKGLFGKSQIRARCELKAAPAPEPSKKTPKKVKEQVEEVFEPKAEEVKAEEAKAEVKAEAKKPRRIGKKEPVAEEPASDASVDASSENVSSTQADADKLVEILRDLIASADLQVTVTVREIGGKYVSIMLDGRDAAFLVGKHGEVLNALQYLLNIMASRKITPGVRATLDANDYRRRREDALTKLATKIAEQVLERQEEAVLDALPAFERRIVHKALSTQSGISTYSEGEEPNRRVVIAPAE